MEKIEKKRCFLQNRPAITALRLVSILTILMCGACYPNPGAPLHPGIFIFVSLRQCSSHLLLSASTHFIVRVLSACVICTLPILAILWFSFVCVFFFFVALISGGVFLLWSRTRYASTCFAHLDSSARFGFSLVSLSVTTGFVSLYDESSGRKLGVLLMSLGRKNERFNVKFFSVSLWPQNLYLSTMKNQEGHWGYCWIRCRWVERTNGLMWRTNDILLSVHGSHHRSLFALIPT